MEPTVIGSFIRDKWISACKAKFMTPVDKASEKEKQSADREEDLRNEWVDEDVKSEGRKPDLEEIENDTSIL
jgi:hypothetical protein